jgi:hypothetical protein
MLIEDKNKWCWVDDDGNAGEPQDTIQDAIDDLMIWNPDLEEILLVDETERVVRIGHPNYYTPEVDAERVIDDIINFDIDDEIAEWACEYLANVKAEHLDELSVTLTKVFREWEKKHGYENTGYVVLETKSYPVDSKGRLIVV